jgi:hypothetical protein
MKTKQSGIVEELKEKHKKRLARAQQELKEDEKRMLEQGSYISDLLLFWKWAYRVGKGWYGFNLGHIPPVWTKMLDEFLCWLEIQCPDFEIHQIKMKLGSLRIYLGTKTDFIIPDENIRSEISKLQNLLRTPHHIRMIKAAQRADEARKKRQKHSRKP